MTSLAKVLVKYSVHFATVPLLSAVYVVYETAGWSSLFLVDAEFPLGFTCCGKLQYLKMSWILRSKRS